MRLVVATRLIDVKFFSCAANGDSECAKEPRRRGFEIFNFTTDATCPPMTLPLVLHEIPTYLSAMKEEATAFHPVRK
jgi:hypothetical protein